MRYLKHEDVPIGGFGVVEDRVRGKLVQWMNEVISEIHSPFDGTDQQVKINFPGGGYGFADIVIWDKRDSRAACLIELKNPIGWTHDVILEDAQKKALHASPQVEYVGTWNIN